MGKKLEKKGKKILISPKLFSGLYFFICGRVLREKRKITLFTEFKSFFSEILAVLNLCGSFVRLTEFELRCEVYYVVS